MLLKSISMCDVYANPYLNEAPMTPGTQAYSFGLGKTVVSMPYWHAREPLLRPERSAREGYVPNLVYTCGAMRQ